MAGLVVALGKNITQGYENCNAEFLKIKQLEVRHKDINPAFCLTKFARLNESDNNFLTTDHISIFVVGTIIYKEMINKPAIEALANDLKDYSIDSLVSNLDGPFFLVVRSPKEGIKMVTDHAGIIQIYKYFNGDNLFLSTSALSLSRSFPVTPDNESIIQFLRNASICDSKTIYQEIEILEPATIYNIELEPKLTFVAEKKYWRSPIQIDERITFTEASARLQDSLLETMKLLSGLNLTCDLTAGFDSRLIISTLLNVNSHGKNGLHAFVFGPQSSKEVDIVKNMCIKFDLNYNHLQLPADWSEIFIDYVFKSLNLTDGEESAFFYAPILYVHEFKSRNFSLGLNGLGGELYRDFWWLQELVRKKKPADLERLIKSRVLQYEFDFSIFSDEWKKKMLKVDTIFKEKYENSIDDMDFSRTFNTLQIDNLYFRQKIRKWAGRTICSSNQMIQTVAPLTFKRNLEVGMTLPPKYKGFGRIVKAVIENINPLMAKQKMLNGAPCQNISINNFHQFAPFVPDYVKRGARKFSQKYFNRTILLDKSLSYDPSGWFRKLLNSEKCKELLAYDNMRTHRLLNKTQFHDFLEEAKVQGFRYHSQLGNLLTLEFRMRNDKVKGYY